MLNHGKRWSQDDLKEMTLLYNEGKSIKYISDKLNRSETAVQSKIDVIVPITISEEILSAIESEVAMLLQKYSLDIRCLYLYLLKIKTKLTTSNLNRNVSQTKPTNECNLDECIDIIQPKIEDTLFVKDEINELAHVDEIGLINDEGVDIYTTLFQNVVDINTLTPTSLIIAKDEIKNVIDDLMPISGLVPISTEGNDNKLTDCQEIAIAFFKLKKSMCITGPAGTGKTFVLNYIKKYCTEEKVNYAMTAMTGVAAALISGQTLHSWTGLGLINKEIGHMINTIKYRKNLYNKWKTIEVLIIDEVSMMEIKLFETLNYIFQQIRNNSHFFGGVQVILCGDFAQLAPIRSDNYIFQSQLWIDNISSNTIYLNKIMRQDDPIFIKILLEIRLGIITDETKAILNSRIIEYSYNNKSNKKTGLIEPTQLFPHKATVAEINNTKLSELLEIFPKIEFLAKDIVQNKETKKLSSAKIDQIKLLDDRIQGKLTFAKNAQVMLKTNLDTANGLVNGSRGIVINQLSIGTGLVILFDNGNTVNITPCEFLIETTQDIIKRIQIPLELAWASTTHKAQGSTITKVITDMRDIFCDAQGYVTLSRVKSLDGLYLIGINYDKITCNKKVIDYYSNLANKKDIKPDDAESATATSTANATATASASATANANANATNVAVLEKQEEFSSFSLPEIKKPKFNSCMI